jgi:hypothetical protein
MTGAAVAARRARRAIGAATCALAAMAGGAPGAAREAQPRTLADLTQRLERIEDYSAFDWITFRLEKGTATLEGFASRPAIRERAEAAAKQASGVDDVVNRIEVLPALLSDDRVRIQAYRAIYGHSGLQRYSPGGAGASSGFLDEIDTAERLGLSASQLGRGPHPIHIIVNGARIILFGTVRSASDRQIAEAQVRTLPSVLGVANRLQVAGR